MFEKSSPSQSRGCTLNKINNKVGKTARGGALPAGDLHNRNLGRA